MPLLEEAKHEAIAVDLPGDDVRAGLSVYADRVLEAIGPRDVILVAQSLGGFTAALMCGRARVRMLVLVNAMIPVRADPRGRRARRSLLPDRVPASRRTGATARPRRGASRRPSPRAREPARGLADQLLLYL